ncbi:amidase domain-containing protein [Lentzea sp. DG1S-22]|uniref:amidase domain-containing protein n=1 Tax=Lentzea sp. DG1S-22 TaxID=3108822 RepID=UPI002E79617E|nr:amidase domain-containing protein [Lentzea sp. DG1S-22]WVH79037.1 amidase domain-containing protein [Lentzea sp. DG1S-22]
MTSVKVEPALQERFATEARQLDAKRELYRRASGGRKAAEVSIGQIVWLSTTPNSVQLSAVETGKLYFVRSAPDGPKFETYWLSHTFSFVRKADGWTLVDTKALVAPGIPPATQPANTTDKNEKEDLKVAGKFRPMASETDRSAPLKAAAPGAKFSGAPRVAGPPYDYSAMVNYAIRYAENYNPNYRAYGNDCTNFVSQVMQAGGWDYVGGGILDRTDPDKWFYGGGPGETFLTSYTWAGAHNWGVFAQIHSQRTWGLSNVWLMDLADVLQVDWDHPAGDPGSIIDHTMVVTGRWGYQGDPFAQELYMTYHTNNRLHFPLSDIIAETNPEDIWYAHRT